VIAGPFNTGHSPRNRPVGALARFPLGLLEQGRNATRQEKLELVGRAHLRLSYRFLGSFPLESLSLPPTLPRLFTLHSDTVLRGSDIRVERRSASSSCGVAKGKLLLRGQFAWSSGQAIACSCNAPRLPAGARPDDHTAPWARAPSPSAQTAAADEAARAGLTRTLGAMMWLRQCCWR
jgi:hypothetical protein